MTACEMLLQRNNSLDPEIVTIDYTPERGSEVEFEHKGEKLLALVCFEPTALVIDGNFRTFPIVLKEI